MSWPAGQGEMASAIRSYDWASTRLGPWEAWPSRVRHAVEIMLDLGTPAYLWLGPDFLQLCNDAMLREEAAPARALLGRPAREICPAWSVLEPLAVQVGGAGAPAEGASFMLSPDGGGVWRGFRLSALRNDEGVVEGVLILVLDATAQALAEQEQAAAAVEAKLIAEIQHRTRNVLAVLRSIARRTAENSRTLADCVMHLDARMAAFTQIQSAILRNPGGQVDLASLIADALLAASAREGERVSIEGPPIALGSAAAEKIGLLLHELLMNAV
jgi:signal transduction histidine kinase